MRPLAGLNRQGTVFAAAVIAGGLVFVPLSWRLHPVQVDQLPLLVYLAVFTQVAAMMPIRWHRGMQTLDTMPLVATGLMLPGFGVAVVAWLFTGYRTESPSGRSLWKMLFNRSKVVLECGIPSLVASAVSAPGWLRIPFDSVVMFGGIVIIGYPLTARAIAYLERESFFRVLFSNVGLFTLQSVLVLAFGGGALAMILHLQGGYLMGVGLLGLLWAVRKNISDVQRQSQEYSQLLELLAQALDARDPMTEKHSQRVADLSERLATNLRWPSKDVDSMRTAGLLHDIGKIGVQDSILRKRGALNTEEWLAMRRHADIGADMIASHPALGGIVPWVRHHHERWDGSGYPHGLVANAIPLGARLLAVADSFDTITGPRVYRPSVMTPEEAVQDISAASGRLYDPEVVDALRRLHGFEPLANQGESEPPAPIRRTTDLVLGLPRFRNLSIGMAVSSLGDPLTTMALVIAVYALSRNVLWVGLVYALRAIATAVSSNFFGGLADRFDRRSVIVLSDFARAATLLVSPIAVSLQILTVFPIVVVLAFLEAVGQSSRDAAVPHLVPASRLKDANALISTGNLITGAAGFALAGGILSVNRGVGPLFVVDAATFVLAGLVTLSVGYLGGGRQESRVGGSMRAIWRLPDLRLPLVGAGAAALFIAMAQPAMVPLAYKLWGAGPQALALLEIVVTVGLVLGNVILLAWVRANMRTLMVFGLAVMGLFSASVAASRLLLVTALVLLVASIGNALYSVGNRSLLQHMTRIEALGSVMSARFMSVQVMAIVGYGIGGTLAATKGPEAVFATIGVGLTLLSAGLGLAFAGAFRRVGPVPAAEVAAAPTPPQQ